MKKAGLKSRGVGGGGGSARSRHYRHDINNSNIAGGGGDGGSSSGENDAFLHNQIVTMKNSSYQKGSNFQPMMSSSAGNHATTTMRHPQQQQQGGGPAMGGYSQPPQRQPPYASQPQQGMGMPNNGGGGATKSGPPNALIRMQQHRQQNKQQNYASDEMALSQKNHRLAKELSDLRVRHREETMVVSRLTMENMNLASRCREAIAQVAALKKEILVYQKRQSEWGTLQREVMLLRNQIDKNAAAAAASSLNNNVSSNGSSSNGGDQQQKHSLALTSCNSGDRGLEINRSSSPATDLDRIMSQQFRKQEKSSAATGSTGAATTTTSVTAESVANGNNTEKKDANAGLAKKFQDLHVSSSVSSQQHSSSSSTNSSTNGEASTSSANSNNSSNKHRSTSHIKIPISVASSAKLQKDDEFDADIDMVDFFAKSQPALDNNSSNSSPTSGGIGTGALSSFESSYTHHLGSRARHTRKPLSTDDHMPADVISPSQHHQGGFSSSPSRHQGSLASPSPPSAGDNLLSSLDAFEASFASAFPETSFSITSEAPLSSAKLDMSFDVPDFDPFFKSPTNNSKDNSSSLSTSSTGNKNNDGILKSQMQDLFPESAMKFKPSSPNKLDNMVFDYSSSMSFTPMESSSEAKKGPGASTPAMVLDKLDTSFIPIQVATKGKPVNITTLDHSKKENEKETSQSTIQKQRQRSLHHRPSPLSPQSMSAEIEQLDVIANLASSEKSESSKNSSNVGCATTAANNNNPSSCRSSARAVRKVKQPISYAEPSTKSKLRRGDVLFPKVDATEKSKKMESESVARSSKGAVTGRGGGRAGTMASSPTTDLDRIMGQMSDIQ
mmetsp:Transcript_34267/g.73008  ORF Transcript_34267/g.73008 Transcript_34267/m.73008 type:complete len:840 (-) Transcript_34267:51-2570(-)